MPQVTTDRDFLHYAETVARRGVGRTAPNPSVGAVVVRHHDNNPSVIIAEATTAPGGRPHAETQALATAGEAARGATLYVSLEPCSHQGQTPPCCDAVIAAGIARVVCAQTDPDERVAGRGLQALLDAGIEVVHLPEQAPEAAANGHLTRIRLNRPLVRLKIATSSDGWVAPGDGTPVWVTGAQARTRGHLLRARSDAILVGSGTLRADNPSLTTRLPGLADWSPIPIVLDAQAKYIDGTRLAEERGDGLIVVTGEPKRGLPGRNLVVSTDKAGRLEPHAILNGLADLGITTVMIEGGPAVAGAFLDAGLVDECLLFRGTSPINGAKLYPFGENGLEQVTKSDEWTATRVLRLGDDTVTLYRHL